MKTGFSIALALSLSLISIPLDAKVIHLTTGESYGEAGFYFAWTAEQEQQTPDALIRSFEQNPDLFTPTETNLLNPGLLDSVVWARAVVHNTSAQTGRWVLSLNRFALDPCEIYLLRSDRVVTDIQTLFDGSSSAYRDAFEAFGTIATEFELSGGERALIYVRYRGSNWSALEPTVLQDRDLIAQQNINVGMFLVFAGILLALMVYAATTSLFLGWRITALYVAGQLSFFAFYAHLQGMTTVYLWPDAPQSVRMFAPVAINLYLISMALFGRQFFETSKHTPRADKALVLSVAIGAISLALFFAPVSNTVPLALTYLNMLITWYLLPGLALYATVHQAREFWPLVVAWGFMGAYVTLIVLIFTGTVSYVPLGKNSYAIFASLEVFFLALAISLRERALHRALRESMQSQLRAAEDREWAIQEMAEKGRLLLSAGHDARQTLFALRGLAKETESSEIAGRLEGISDHLEDVMGTAMSASSSGGVGDDVVCLNTISFADLIAPLQMIHQSRAMSQGVDLRFHPSEHTLVTDKVLLLRMLSNLITNALDHARPRKVLVGARTAGTFKIQVWDDGVGLQSASTTQGSGAGLVIVSRIAARLGARLEVRSQPNWGSCFELTMPEPEPPTKPLRIALHSNEAGLRRNLEIVAVNLPIDLVDERPDVIIMDDDAHSPEFERSRTIVTTFDQSAEVRERLSAITRTIVYKPVTPYCLRTAMLITSATNGTGNAYSATHTEAHHGSQHDRSR